MPVQKQYSFVSPVLRQEVGLRQHYLPIPTEIAEAFLDEGVRRVHATLNGHTARRAIQGNRDGERFLLLGRDLLREIGADYGDLVTVILEPDPEPDRIDLGEELTAVLEQDKEAAERFFGMTPGRQRSLATYVTGAKRPETRVSRALELAEQLRTYTLYGDLTANR